MHGFVGGGYQGRGNSDNWRMALGEGFPTPCLWGRLFARITEGGPRLREDNERKGDKISGLRCAPLGMTCCSGRMSDGFPPPREQRREGWVPASARTRDRFVHARGHWRAHPHPNLPPSRGKGFVGAERSIFIVMRCFPKGDGSPHARGQGEGRRGCRMCEENGRVHPHPPSSRGQALTFPPSRGEGKEREGMKVPIC